MPCLSILHTIAYGNWYSVAVAKGFLFLLVFVSLAFASRVCSEFRPLALPLCLPRILAPFFRQDHFERFDHLIFESPLSLLGPYPVVAKHIAQYIELPPGVLAQFAGSIV